MIKLNLSKMLAKKFHGCLVGALCGDCFGSPYEGDENIHKSQLQKYFDTIENVSYKTPCYKYTDDTAMMKSVAESLIENKGFSADHLARSFVQKYFAEPNRGYGYNVTDIFHKWNNTNISNVWKPAEEQFNGIGSLGNGGAMRIQPVALYHYNDYDSMIELARNVTKLTHTHIQAINGAILLSIAIQRSLHLNADEPLDTSAFITNMVNKMAAIERDTSNFRAIPETTTYEMQLSKMHKLLHSDASDYHVIEALGNSIRALYSVPTAIYCFLRAQQSIPEIETDNGFRRTIQYAISLGGDTDTIACMAGSIAGAYYGLDAINNKLQELCEGIEDINKLSQQLITLVNVNVDQ